MAATCSRPRRTRRQRRRLRLSHPLTMGAAMQANSLRSALRMTGNALPHDPIAVELGAIAGRVERELRLQVAALLAEVREELTRLRAWRAEAAADIAARLAALHDGPPGPQGEPGERG